VLDTLITNKTRLKLLLRFFLKTGSKSYLRGLEEEFDESTNAIRLELNRFEEAGLLLSNNEGNRKFFIANQAHPLFSDISRIIRKHIGIDRIIEQVVDKLGNVRKAYLVGNLAKGLDSKNIELVLVVDTIDMDYLDRLLRKTEALIKRNITCLILKAAEERQYLVNYPDALLIWEGNDFLKK
jgi:hypothetical protein